MTELSPGRTAWDYGIPQAAVESVDATLREGIGLRNEPTFELAANGSRVVVSNLAAAIVHDLITSGAMAPSTPDVPPEPRP